MLKAKVGLLKNVTIEQLTSLYSIHHPKIKWGKTRDKTTKTFKLLSEFVESTAIKNALR